MCFCCSTRDPELWTHQHCNRYVVSVLLQLMRLFPLISVEMVLPCKIQFVLLWIKAYSGQWHHLLNVKKILTTSRPLTTNHLYYIRITTIQWKKVTSVVLQNNPQLSKMTNCLIDSFPFFLPLQEYWGPDLRHADWRVSFSGWQQAGDIPQHLPTQHWLLWRHVWGYLLPGHWLHQVLVG